MRMVMRRAFVFAAVAALFVLTVASTAVAGPPGESGAVVRGPGPADFVYWEGSDVVLTGNNSFADGCVGIGFQEVTLSTVSPGNGSGLGHSSAADVAVLVFEVDNITSVDDLFAWLAASCAATVSPEPVAEGSGRLTAHFRIDADGVSYNHNGVAGNVTTSEGDQVHVNTLAQLAIGPAGLDLRQLRVNYGG